MPEIEETIQQVRDAGYRVERIDTLLDTAVPCIICTKPITNSGRFYCRPCNIATHTYCGEKGWHKHDA